MKIKLFVEIKGNIDSLILWELIKDYKMNLTDVVDKSWVYGDADPLVAAKVVSICALFGDIKAELTHGGGGADEQEKAQST